VKKFVVVATILALALGMIWMAGCGKKETTIETPEGKVKVTEEGGEVTYETEEGEGKYKVTEEEPSEEDLGAPVYPDAEYVEGSGGTVSGSSEEGEFTTSGAEYRTGDDFNKVVGWYKDKLGEPMYIDTTANEASWMLSISEKEVVVVTVTQEEGGVSISIGRMKGEM